MTARKAKADHSVDGEQILRDPTRNKGLAFTREERRLLGIEGLLPPAVLTLQQQVAMTVGQICAKNEPLEQYIGLTALLGRNETLFFRVLLEHLDRFAPIIYTPTVGLACQRFSHIYRRPRGLFITPDDRGQIADRLRELPGRDIRLIVVTDNERILGLGDQGAGGMGIPVGKLILYSVGAGIHPSLCLPISLDVGTDNAELLEDPFYIGYRARRLRGAEYDALVEEFVEAVKAVFPNALLQWEDFKKNNAIRLLERYQRRLPSFNDDIQGTAAVTVAGILSGLGFLGKNLRDQRMLLVGAGAAGIGVGDLISAALKTEGLNDTEIRRRKLYLDSGGIVHVGRGEMDDHKRAIAWTPEDFAAAGMGDTIPVGLEAVVQKFRPTILVGMTGTPGEFTPGVIRAMAKHCDQPLIFPLSNPTSKAECTPSEALQHSDGRALVATGSPFEPVLYQECRHVIGQCNNAFIFPGVGLGALVAGASQITNSMFLAAARTLAEYTVAHNAGGEPVLFPTLAHLRDISRAIGLKVAQTARDEGV
ncbi:MAG TPA: NAD-dependent malic enzyme, partial [Dongiaceae bacterium]|nr:NAD-dependent malic enzyme [Dongiaceae bacterium]